jgi:hypothetical protein
MPPVTPDIAGLMFDVLSRAVRTEFNPDLFEIAKTRVVAAPLCQGSCPLLYFSSISQVGGIGR